jgi:hypothetical protein
VGAPTGGGREVPGVPVDRPKPPETPYEPTDKLRPVLPPFSDPHHRDDAMLNLTTSACFAFLGGALLAVEQAKALPPVPPVPGLTLPGIPVRADEPDKLKKDLDEAKTKIEAANARIKALELLVEKLNEQLNGKKDADGFKLTSDPGAVEEIKRLKNRITDLEGELGRLRTQTALKPAVVPALPGKGIVKIINDYPVEITMLINEKSTYHVAPNTTLEVEVPTGAFTYQLLQSGAAPTRSVIKDKEVVKLRIK